ncbi:hypothetical protein Tco_0581961 [Tanacetum coccineum]
MLGVISALLETTSLSNISSEGFTLRESMADLCSNETWNLPSTWDGGLLDFAVRVVWDSIMPRGQEVDWFRMVWKLVLKRDDLRNAPVRLDDITTWLLPLSSKSSIISVVSRLVFAASTYFIWQERNNRIYSKGMRKEEQVCDSIIEIVRLKLLSLRFKKSTNVLQTLQVWKIPFQVK